MNERRIRYKVIGRNEEEWMNDSEEARRKIADPVRDLLDEDPQYADVIEAEVMIADSFGSWRRVQKLR